MNKEIHTDQAPEAIGPYSQGVRVGQTLYISGQIPLDPTSGQIGAEDIQGQTKLVLSHIQSILASEGLSMAHVVKTEVFLADMSDFAAMNEIYASFFNKEPMPARQAIEAARLPKDVKVEISCIAYES